MCAVNHLITPTVLCFVGVDLPAEVLETDIESKGRNICDVWKCVYQIVLH